MNPIETPLTILLVEDLPDDVYFFRRTLAKTGLAVDMHVAEDGVDAIHYLSHQGRFADPSVFRAPHVVFLDLKLPHLDGFEVLQWIRENSPCRPPVIILTSSSEPQDRERALALEATNFLTKPITAEQLVEALSYAAAIQAKTTQLAS